MKATVLIVDDEPRVLDALRRTLERKGYTVVCADGAEAALDRLGNEAIDVVISDENMPGIRGVELLASVAKEWPATVRIMLTGHSDLEIVMKAINDGHVHLFCLKPCDGESLLGAMEKCMRQAELERASWKLLQVARNQARALEDIERRFPGATHVEKDQCGAIVLKDYEAGQVSALIREICEQVGEPLLDLTGQG